VWWLLGLLIVLAVVVIAVMSVRARRARKAWDAQLAAVVAETTWLAHQLLPDVLTSRDTAERLATWTAYRPRVEALANSLSEATASAPKERWASLDRLCAAVSELNSAMDAYAAATPLNDRERLGAVQQSQRWVEEALHAIQRTLDHQSGESPGRQ
jgi:hypothetical protein